MFPWTPSKTSEPVPFPRKKFFANCEKRGCLNASKFSLGNSVFTHPLINRVAYPWMKKFFCGYLKEHLLNVGWQKIFALRFVLAASLIGRPLQLLPKWG